jgi:hypothetical protein
MGGAACAHRRRGGLLGQHGDAGPPAQFLGRNFSLGRGGLVILAWLALWRPAEALLYGWVPYYRKRRRYKRLARIHVAVRLGSSKRLAIPPATAKSVAFPTRTEDSANPVGC